MKGNVIGALFLLATASLSAAEPSTTNSPLPGVLRQQDRVFLVENHSTAYLIWHALGIRGATLVHLDTHDDCRYVDPQKLQRLKELGSRKDYEALFLQSDLGSSFDFKVKPADMLYDLGNFIYPCIADGTVSNFWWVVPNKSLDTAARDLLKNHLQRVLHLPSPLKTTDDSTNAFSFVFNSATVTVTTLDALPALPPGALLDVDTDFFVFPTALSEDHLRGKLTWSPAGVCTTLSQRVPAPAAVTVSSSIWGGYTPLIYRCISDACFDYASTGQYPPYASRLLACMETLAQGPGSVDLPPPPDTPVFAAAYEHLNALVLLMKGKDDEATQRLLKAAAASPGYGKGILDAAEALMVKGKFKAAYEDIDRYDQRAGHVTFPSIATRLRVNLEEGQPDKAERLALRLLAWDRQPFALLLYGGVLTQQNRFDEAMAVYQEVIQSDPNSSAAYYNMGFLQERKGNSDPAIELYRTALALRPNFDRALEHLGYLLSTQGKTDEAVQVLTKAVAASPLNTMTWNNLGLALCRQGHTEDGIRCYERAVLLNPDMAETRANLGFALAAAGRKEEAVAQYREALRLKPGWERATTALAQLLKQKEKP